MPYKDPADAKEYQLAYDQKNKERKKEYYEKNKERKKEYYEKNKEKINQRQKEYRENNKEKINQRHKEYDQKNKERKKVYNQTPSGLKSSRLSNWKFNGVIHNDFDELYEKYINTEFCELCNVELTVDRQNTSTTRCLDHDHTTGEFRNVICHSCNTKRG